MDERTGEDRDKMQGDVWLPIIINDFMTCILSYLINCYNLRQTNQPLLKDY